MGNAVPQRALYGVLGQGGFHKRTEPASLRSRRHRHGQSRWCRHHHHQHFLSSARTRSCCTEDTRGQRSALTVSHHLDSWRPLPCLSWGSTLLHPAYASHSTELQSRQLRKLNSGERPVQWTLAEGLWIHLPESISA